MTFCAKTGIRKNTCRGLKACTGSGLHRSGECSAAVGAQHREPVGVISGDVRKQEEIGNVEPRKILIVDDEPALSALLCEALEMEGPYRVDSACNGLEGVEKYKELSPDLVIMDMNMPVMNGYDSSRTIKSYDQHARILVLTGNPSDIRAKRTIKEGFALALLEKPMRIHELARIVSSSLPKPS